MGADTLKRWMLGLIAAWPVMAMGGPAQLAGQPAPDFALKATTGENHRLSEYRGDVVLLTFFAEWCGRCSRQLHTLAELQRRHQDGLKVIAVSIDPADHAARETAARLGLDVLRDPAGRVARQYRLEELPLLLVLDPSGQVRHLHEGYRDEDERRLQEELHALLNERAGIRTAAVPGGFRTRKIHEDHP